MILLSNVIKNICAYFCNKSSWKRKRAHALYTEIKFSVCSWTLLRNVRHSEDFICACVFFSYWTNLYIESILNMRIKMLVGTSSPRNNLVGNPKCILVKKKADVRLICHWQIDVIRSLFGKKNYNIFHQYEISLISNISNIIVTIWKLVV